MTSPEHPISYTDYHLPQIKLAHHPASSPVATPIVLVILDRPAAKNAFTDTMVTSLVTAFGLLSSDPRVKAIVFTGGDERNRIFCPGMDLDQASASTAPAGSAAPDHQERVAGAVTGTTPDGKPPSPAELARQRLAHRDGGAQVSLAIFNCAKPVVAAINGHAVGVGITMTLPCNARVVSRESKVGFVFARRGINMEATSSFFLPRILGAGRALTLVTTGATYKPDHHLIRDLFVDVVDPDQVLPRALELADEIATNTSSVSTKAMKDMLYRGAQSPEEALLLESRVFFDLFRGADAREGIVSFLEKRPPKFDGVWEKERPFVWPWWSAPSVDVEGEQSGGILGWLRSKL
jgi:enoyl-CoA hydratase/carnithine racemase